MANEIPVGSRQEGNTLEENKGREGFCIKCGKELPIWKLSNMDGDHMLKPYKCTACGHEGEEVYNVTFVEVR